MSDSKKPTRTLAARTVSNLLLLVVLFVFPTLKVLEIFDEVISDVDKEALRVPHPNAVDKLGYGVIRRLDDANFWILLSLLLASSGVIAVHREIFRLAPGRSKPIATLSDWCRHPLCGAVFCTFYLVGTSFEPGGYFFPKRGFNYDYVIQCIEATCNVLVLYFAGCSLQNYARLAGTFRSEWSRVSKSGCDAHSLAALTRATQSLFGVGFIPVIAITLFAAASSFFPRLQLGDRITWAVVQFIFFILPFFVVFLWARLRLREFVELHPAVGPVLFDVHIASPIPPPSAPTNEE